jgi:hypothetical protein
MDVIIYLSPERFFNTCNNPCKSYELSLKTKIDGWIEDPELFDSEGA